jgi:hypothetical protein
MADNFFDGTLGDFFDGMQGAPHLPNFKLSSSADTASAVCKSTTSLTSQTSNFLYLHCLFLSRHPPYLSALHHLVFCPLSHQHSLILAADGPLETDPRFLATTQQTLKHGLLCQLSGLGPMGIGLR